MKGWICFLVMVPLAAGCGTSRWAMDDPDYAAKYSKPYEGDKIPRMAKQAVDARFVEHKTGTFCQASGQTSPFNLGGELGKFYYLSPCLSGRLGLAGLVSTNVEGCAFLGADVGARVQTPTRLAPFAGVGAMAGISEWWNINEDETTYYGEDDSHGMAAVYPELGVHFWLTGKTRLSLSGSYMVTTEGRKEDFWYYGVTFSFLDD